MSAGKLFQSSDLGTWLLRCGMLRLQYNRISDPTNYQA